MQAKENSNADTKNVTNSEKEYDTYRSHSETRLIQ